MLQLQILQSPLRLRTCNTNGTTNSIEVPRMHTSPPVDRSDRKSLDILIENLIQTQKAHKLKLKSNKSNSKTCFERKATRTPERKKTKSNTPCTSKTISKKKHKISDNLQMHTLDSWLINREGVEKNYKVVNSQYKTKFKGKEFSIETSQFKGDTNEPTDREKKVAKDENKKPKNTKLKTCISPQDKNKHKDRESIIKISHTKGTSDRKNVPNDENKKPKNTKLKTCISSQDKNKRKDKESIIKISNTKETSDRKNVPKDDNKKLKDIKLKTCISPQDKNKFKDKESKVVTSNSTGATRKKIMVSEKSDSTKLKSDKSGIAISESFKKYGIRVPTFKDIVQQQKKYQNHKQCIEDIEAVKLSDEYRKLDIKEKSLVMLLDCKHLTDAKLKEAFRNNEQYVHDIFHGFEYSVRHERFHAENFQDHCTAKDLKYNTSMVVFTFQQKRLLLSCLHKKFDPGEDICKNNRYFFKVLLPELCTKIFMDTHNMSYQDAYDYLEERPVD